MSQKGYLRKTRGKDYKLLDILLSMVPNSWWTKNVFSIQSIQNETKQKRYGFLEMFQNTSLLCLAVKI